MDIVLSHISALRFWLSRPACSVRLRYADPILPVSALPKGKAAELAVYGGVPVHVLCAGPIKGGVRNGAIYHTWQGDLPAGSVARIAPGLCVCSPELSFLQMAQTLDEVSQIRLGFELCGSYSLDARADGGFFKRSSLTAPEKLGALCAIAQGRHGVKRAKTAAQRVITGSASPAETRLAMMLSMPCRVGGAGLPSPVLNHRISLSSYQQRLLQRRYFLCDLYWPEKQLAVEYDSDSFHIGPDRIAKDAQRRNALEHLDVKVITATSQTCRDPQQLNAISRMIARRLDHAIRPRCRDYERKQHMLRANLFNNPPWL